ncbi:hypothetical protein ES703_14025 [subsurface metagenome]
MSEKYTVIRNESTKLKDLDPEILSLYDQTALAITKAEVEAEEEQQKTQDELIKTIYQAVLLLLEERKVTSPEPKDNEVNVEQLTKSLESMSGVPLKAVIKGQRRRIE